MKEILINIRPSTVYFQPMIGYALKIAKHFKATITFIVILEEYGPLRFEKEEKDLKEIMAQFQPLITDKDQKIQCRYQVLYGETKKVLTEITENLKPDLLIVSTQINDDLVMDLAEKEQSIDLAQHISCPVLLMPPSETEREIKRIVYTTEFAFEDINALNFLEDWARIFKANLLCLHVCQYEADLPKAEKKMEALKERFPDKIFQYQIIIGEVVESIQKTIDLCQTDLIVGLHQRRSWWSGLLDPSVTGEIAKKSSIPMIIFKEQV